MAVARPDGVEVGPEAEMLVGPVDVGDAAWLEPEVQAAAASDSEGKPQPVSKGAYAVYAFRATKITRKKEEVK